MSKKPKPTEEGISTPRGKDEWAPGQRADGSIIVMTPDEALKAIGERNAYEDAFGDMLDNADDISDLDDDIPA